ncbi:hypothetical protein EVAR_97851_1 [Eumeta japonica]|uniref:Uncharacterized protein n=1 Tax=Eumeta variegata TaxID=151549 RepID=A0A4C1WXL2_EUMVA|nr:hypothetical protein EVAR_97851_1 [Eumeta japonica]
MYNDNVKKCTSERACLHGFNHPTAEVHVPTNFSVQTVGFALKALRGGPTLVGGLSTIVFTDVMATSSTNDLTCSLRH